MVSYNDCGFIRELYRGCEITPVSRLNNLAQRFEDFVNLFRWLVNSCQ